MESVEENPQEKSVLVIKNAILAWHVDIKWNGLSILYVYLSRR